MTTEELCHAHDVSLRPGIIGSSAAAGFGARCVAGLAPRHAREGAFRDPWAGHPRAPLSFHVAAQFPDAPFAKDGQAAIKFNSFWTIELEPGWSLFATHPVNRDDLPFRLIAGLVDSDRFHDGGINFPAIWARPDFSGVLPRGTPVAQCFAVPREAPQLEFECFDQPHQAAYAKTVAEVLSNPGVYRKRFRARRGRSTT